MKKQPTESQKKAVEELKRVKASLARMPEWTAEEIAELGPGLRQYVTDSLKLQKRLRIQPFPMRYCAKCHKRYLPIDEKQRFCSALCRLHAHREQHAVV